MYSFLMEKRHLFFGENHTGKVQLYAGEGQLSNLLETNVKTLGKFVSLLLDSPEKLW